MATSLLVATDNFSFSSWRAQLALVEKGIPFTLVPLNIADKPKELLEANPIYGKVPLLLHNGNSICESAVILEYLEDAWPKKKPLMPKHAVAKSKVRFWADYINKEFENMAQIGGAKLGRRPTGEATAESVQKFFETLEAAMVEYSADGPFFTGDQFGYLDVVLAPLSRWRKASELIVESPMPGPDKLPRLHKWMKAMDARKSIQETLPSDDATFEFFANRIKRYQEGQEKLQAGVAR